MFAAEQKENAKKKQIFSLLPDGSRLMEVMLPSYDEDHNLVGVLKAGGMTLVNDQTMAGEAIKIQFFNPDRSLRGSADLSNAVFSKEKGMLEAREPVLIQSDKINAKGEGLFYDFEAGKGLLIGPAITWTNLEKDDTAMNTSSSKLRATAAVGVALVTQQLAPGQQAASPAGAPAETSSANAAHSAEMKAAKSDLASQLDASTATNEAAKAFLENTGIKSPAGAEPPPATGAEPLDLKPGPSDTVISSDGGMYFDSKEGCFVYLKNVRVNNPDLSMNGANELKVYLEKIPEDAAKKADTADKPKKEKGAMDLGGKLGGKFGDVQRIVATGTIVIEQKPKDGKEPIRASGAIFSYNIPADEIIVSGGLPWVVQGRQGFRAKEANAILKIKPKDESFRTEGAWDTILNLEKKK